MPESCTFRAYPDRRELVGWAPRAHADVCGMSALRVGTFVLEAPGLKHPTLRGWRG